MTRITRFTVLPILLLAVAGVVLLSGAPEVEAKGGKYIDKKYGFSIKIPQGWSQTPLQPNERIEVAKWKDDRKGDFAKLSISRFAVSGAAVTTPDGTGEEGEEPEEEEPENPFAAVGPENATEMITGMIQREMDVLKLWGKRTKVEVKLPNMPKPRKVKFGKKIEGQLYMVLFEAQPKLPVRYDGTFYCAGVVSNGVEEYLILFSCAKNRANKSRNGFISTIRSFRFKGEEEVEEEDPEERGKALKNQGELLDPEKRERIKKQLVGTWKYFDTKHYIVIYNCDLPLAKTIANRIEYMRVNAFEKVFPPPYPITECGVIRVCKEFDEYYHYGGPRGSAGYWSSGTDELVFPDLSRSKKADEKTIGVLHHEGFHQYVFYALAGNSPPIWFNEGFAEYFFCVNSKGKKLSFMKKHPMRYGIIKTAMSSDKITPIKKFIWLSQREHYANSGLHYAEGWALCTWMMNHASNERYRQIPVILFQEMQKGFVEQKKKREDGEFPGFGGFGRGPKGNPILKAATEKAFEGIDLDQLEKDFKKEFKRKM